VAALGGARGGRKGWREGDRTHGHKREWLGSADFGEPVASEFGGNIPFYGTAHLYFNQTC
jgi:hypothetical protein